jgi:hypothetical protein
MICGGCAKRREILTVALRRDGIRGVVRAVPVVINHMIGKTNAKPPRR